MNYYLQTAHCNVLLHGSDMLALNVYLAMCYHKLDYYDVSQEVLASYVQQHVDSVVAINLKACNYYKLYNGKAAEVTRRHAHAPTQLPGHPPTHHPLFSVGRAEGADGSDLSFLLICQRPAQAQLGERFTWCVSNTAHSISSR